MSPLMSVCPTKFLAPVQKSRDRRKFSCTHCGRPGHIASDCYHNPLSTSYRKGYRGKPKRNYKPISQSKKFAEKVSPIQEGEYNPDVAIISNSVLDENEPMKKPMFHEWMVDSASTSHICNDRSHFETLRLTPCKTVEVGERQLVTLEGTRSFKGISITKIRSYRTTFKAVLYVPTMIFNLISLSKTTRSGFQFIVDSYNENNGYC